MRIKIEEAKRKDINSILKLNVCLTDFHRKIDKYYKSGERFSESFKKFILRNFKKKSFKILVAKDKNKTIGYFIGRIHKARPITIPKKIGQILDAFILENYQRKGVGKQMFEVLIKWFKANKIKHIELPVDARNKIGIKAWKKYGFFEFLKKCV